MAPLGIVVFATLMGMSAVLVLVESVKFLSDGLTKNAPTASEPADKVAGTVAILGFVVVVKILLLVGCRHVQNLRGSGDFPTFLHFGDPVISPRTHAGTHHQSFHDVLGRVGVGRHREAQRREVRAHLRHGPQVRDAAVRHQQQAVEQPEDVRGGLQAKRLLIESRWMSKPLAFAGELRPRRLYN
jgi:hypothetical protein